MWKRKRTLDELLEQRRIIDAELQERGAEELENLKGKLELLAEAQGVRIADLFHIRPSSPEEPKRRKKRESKAKFVNPDNPEETYGGRGRKPQWLQEKIDAGAQMEEFAVA